ncbi:hypothetical protein EVAR_17073_1 [Eumeta japonica]|uniref:Uncharacterized protein n=1 Tax=Eumeta variegata TaxID=151549 RepID=A0A4C1V7M1_EUMVA|nr:hypothetical protein EVAR_17073_1 [Eumeta japonica]
MHCMRQPQRGLPLLRYLPLPLSSLERSEDDAAAKQSRPLAFCSSSRSVWPVSPVRRCSPVCEGVCCARVCGGVRVCVRTHRTGRTPRRRWPRNIDLLAVRAVSSVGRAQRVAVLVSASQAVAVLLFCVNLFPFRVSIQRHFVVGCRLIHYNKRYDRGSTEPPAFGVRKFSKCYVVREIQHRPLVLVLNNKFYASRGGIVFDKENFIGRLSQFWISPRTGSRRFIVNIEIPAHPPYRPDLAPCGFYLFPKIKEEFRGKRFADAEEAVAEYEKAVAASRIRCWRMTYESNWSFSLSRKTRDRQQINYYAIDRLLRRHQEAGGHFTRRRARRRGTLTLLISSDDVTTVHVDLVTGNTKSN